MASEKLPKTPKAPKPFECKICDFMTSKESNYNTHLTTRKHKNLTNPNTIPIKA